VYGDLDISVIDELPPGRVPVRTLVRREPARESVYQGRRDAVRRGRQVYIVAPTVEDGGGGLKSATGLARRLVREVFPEIPVGLLHGRLSADEKAAVMERFRSGRLPILVATTVIEVGLDVPNATVMVVEDAGRFGLAQLHQLRGRVGRGGEKATCILMTGDGPASPEAEERLAVIAGTSDGFLVAEKDLELRGPGSLLGVEQHGAGDLWFLRQAVARPDLLAEARAAARRLLERDGGSLAAAEQVLARMPARWRSRLRIGSVG
jgi:ATP-dependent DNA helicase RecG